ncbi:DUF6366 family protein [Priestia koreensis]|uniref:DUF6366 family protein n=1 Tax=Priestia koreensis TaxID=284581 RepID=UPI001F5892EE|nr:DUF6366 family protein [Priestia koreensis]UNL86802.1 hypothetical protein IE339_10055 [Priestia koreensis]
MGKEKERFEYTTERRRQQELKRNASFSQGFNRATNGSLIDLVNGLGWKGLGILILLLLVVFTAFILF